MIRNISKKIFVSYTTRDKVLTKSNLSYLSQLLHNFGIPYIDLLHNLSTNPQKFVINKLENSDILIGCLTPKYFESPWTKLELKIAKDRGIPIFYYPITHDYIITSTKVNFLYDNLHIHHRHEEHHENINCWLNQFPSRQ